MTNKKAGRDASLLAAYDGLDYFNFEIEVKRTVG